MGRLAALLGLLVTYYVLAPHLWNAGTWWDVAWIACVLMPAVFGLVLLALPLREARWLLPVGLAFAALAAVLTVTHADIGANFSRLGATTLLGWWFLGYFETLGWVVLVASIIPWVDAYSVWRGPTKSIVAHHEHVFTVLSFAFPVPGLATPQGLHWAQAASLAGEPISENGLGQFHGLVPFPTAANLGVPDLLFFALFLAAAVRFGMRVYATWICLVAALGTTIALTVWFDLNGLPALPAIAIGFLLPNADLIWHRLRGRPGIGDHPPTGVRPLDVSGSDSS